MSPDRPLVVRLAGREFTVALERDTSGKLYARVDTGEDVRRMEIAVARPGRILLDREPLEYCLARGDGARLRLHAGGESWPVDVVTEVEAALASAAPARAGGARETITVRSPMPGRVLAVEVAEGDRVQAGAGLFIVEAMKMENEIRAPAPGRVRGLRVADGDAVEQDQPLCSISAEAGPRDASPAPDPEAALPSAVAGDR